jgi:hypothetical protein
MMSYTKSDMLEKMADLAFEMRYVAQMMLYFGGLNAEMVQHAKELSGAADMLETWIEGIEGDME